MDSNPHRHLQIWTSKGHSGAGNQSTGAPQPAVQTAGPDTSDSEAEVHLRHVISCAGLGDTVVTGVLDQRPLAEPAAHEDLPVTQHTAVLHNGGIQAVAIF